jgi:glutamyl-tRNA synthetase
MTEKVRVRFAPAPTGYLHVGVARTALFNWLYARRKGGQFVLRIEDTDAEKSSEEMVRAITEGLTWLGITWDEGPYFQSERLKGHKEIVGALLEQGRAYRCFCSKDAIEAERKSALDRGETYTYSGRCRDLTGDDLQAKLEAGEPCVVRLKVQPGVTVFNDLIYGQVAADNISIGDFILSRTDGRPTYHLAVVADDIDMEITHVIRGEDHRLNTLKHILIYDALDHRPPVYAHLPLILGSDRSKLSKRHGATYIGVYREEGILPEALFNFIALLGWSPGDDRELMSREELTDSFSLERVSKKSAIFDPTKLDWMNGQYLSGSSPDRLSELVTPLLEATGLFDPRYHGEEKDWYHKVLTILSDRAHRLGDFVVYGVPFFADEFEYDPDAVSKLWKSGSTVEYLSFSRDAFSRLDAFSVDQIEAGVRDLAEKHGISAAKFIHPIRVAVTGKAVGPSLFVLLELLGRDVTVERIDRAIDYLNSHPEIMGA